MAANQYAMYIYFPVKPYIKESCRVINLISPCGYDDIWISPCGQVDIQISSEKKAMKMKAMLSLHKQLYKESFDR